MIDILSCLLNNQRINCVDGEYTRDQLKKWAKKRILLCPACNKPYEYCHGKVIPPYFRHMDKEECIDKYSEPETEEHIKGKTDLYNWLLTQDDVTDVTLEGWLSGTKQRPDIMFKYEGKQYVLEYQCSPISTEYYERHELYEAAGIKDIWILGEEKYLKGNMRKKCIQDGAFGFYSPKDKMLIPIVNNNIYYRSTLTRKSYSYEYNSFIGRPINNFVFDGEIYDLYTGKISEIEKKKEYRRSLKKFNPSWHLNHNHFTYLQKNKMEKKLKDNLKVLSNENWIFYEYWTHSKYKSFCYICAEPVLHTNSFEYEKNHKKLKEIYGKIKMWQMSSDEYKLCVNDIEYLKTILTPIMNENINKLIRYEFKDIGVLRK